MSEEKAPLKLLIVTRKERSRSFSTLFDGISQYFETTTVYLSKEQIGNFTDTVNDLGCHRYDRVMFDVPLRRIGKHYKVLKSVQGLILYEEDAYQEFVPRSEYYKKYSKIYRKVGACRLVLTGYNVGERIRDAGLDVVVIPKAYDENHLHNLGLGRDVELGFVGRIKNKIYRKRYKFLKSFVKQNHLELFKTDPGEEYLQTLNRIKVFVSADIGLLEYMAKNFEAMACGCLVLAKRQGGLEEDKLGLKHMENIVLYDELKDARVLLSKLKATPGMVETIAREGQLLAERQHTLGARVQPFVDAIKPAVKEPQERKSVFSGWFNRKA